MGHDFSMVWEAANWEAKLVHCLGNLGQVSSHDHSHHCRFDGHCDFSQSSICNDHVDDLSTCKQTVFF
jgi:hypothetical protein